MANVRAPNLDFTGTDNPNRIPVSVAVAATATPAPVTSAGAAQRAPSSLNFALGVRPNAITVSAPVAATSGELVIFPSIGTSVAAPQLSEWGDTIIGGAGSGTVSVPICG